MVIFVWFKCKLFFWFKSFFLKSLDFALKYDGRFLGRVDAVGFDGDHKVSTIFKEILAVHADDSGLVGLCDVSKDNVNHSY